MIEREAADLPLSTQADLLQLSRASLYYQAVRPSSEEVALKHRIDELYTAHPFYGSRKLTALLRQERGPLSRKTVQRHMREMGIAGLCPGPNLSKRSSEHRIYTVFTAAHQRRAAKSCLGCGYYVCADAGELDVLGGSVGLVFALCSELGSG